MVKSIESGYCGFELVKGGGGGSRYGGIVFFYFVFNVKCFVFLFWERDYLVEGGGEGGFGKLAGFFYFRDFRGSYCFGRNVRLVVLRGRTFFSCFR